MKNGNNKIPVSMQPRLQTIAPLGLYMELELPKSLNQLFTGLTAVEKRAQEEKVKAQYTTMTATPARELIGSFIQFHSKTHFLINRA